MFYFIMVISFTAYQDRILKRANVLNDRIHSKQLYYIYIIYNGSNSVKVGITKNDPDKRLKQLSTGNDSKLELKYFEKIECSHHHVLLIEKNIHSELGKTYERLNGEWFRIKDDSDIEYIESVVVFNRMRYENDYLALYRK